MADTHQTDESSNVQNPQSAPDSQFRDREDAGKKEILVYSFGGIIDELTTSGFRNLNTLLIVAFQVNPLIVGFIGALKTIWDGVMDPIVAHFSDNCKSRFGRRRPFILSGGIVMALCAWITWQFMPENPNLKANSPPVPEVYFADQDWKDFGDLNLAYGLEDYNVGVALADSGFTDEQRERIELFAVEAIKTLSGDTKALVKYADTQSPAGDAADTTGESSNHIESYTVVVENPGASNAHLAKEPPGEWSEYSGELKLTLSGKDADISRTVTVRIDGEGETLDGLERTVPVINKIVYFFIGTPKEHGLTLSTGNTTLSYNVLQDRAVERAQLAAIKLGMIELLSREYGLPFWRILSEDAQVAGDLKARVKQTALARFENDGALYKRMLVSAGVKVDLKNTEITQDEQEKVAGFVTAFDRQDPLAVYDALYGTLDIGAAASYQVLARDPLKTRQFKSLGQKLADGFGAFFNNSPQEQRFLWFVLIMFLAMAIGSTLYNAAYYAQGIEIAPSYHGRTLVVAYRSVANTAINIVSQVFLPLSFMPIFVNTVQGNLFLVYVLAPVGLILAVVVFFGTKERTVMVRDTEKKPNFFRAIKEIGSLWEFWRITLLYVFMGYALGSFAGLGSLISIYYVFSGNMLLGASYTSIAGTIGMLMGAASIPAVVILCKKFGKHNTLRMALGSLALASVLKYFCYNPEHPWLLFIPSFFYSPAIAGFYNVLSTMMGDVTDLDELKQGERREAMFGAVMAVIMKSIGSFSAVASGLVIVLSGFEVQKGVHQDPGVFHNMLVLFSIVPGLVSLIGFGLLSKFKLTPERVAEIKEELAGQRAQRAQAQAQTQPRAEDSSPDSPV